jgi:GTP cyclohydrolase I
MEKEILDWEHFKTECIVLGNMIRKEGKEYKNIYPILRAGSYVALVLSKMLDLPLISHLDKTDNGTLVVDDIVDSGRTLEQYKDYDTAVLHIKDHAKTQPTYYVRAVDKWIEYPWEVGSEGVEENIVRLLEYMGENPNREGLIETPKRVVKGYKQWFSGYNKDPKDVMKTFTSANDDQIVIVKNIDFYSHCEHHMAPFYGQVHIGYLPNGKVLGVSKFSRLTDIYARRLQIQEQLTNQIAQAINEHLKPKGVGVIIEGIHLCMRSRGVQKQNSIMTTSVMLGDFRELEGLRKEFLQLVKGGDVK